MKQGSTLFLKFVLGTVALATLAFCLVGLPLLIRAELRATGDFDYGFIFVGMYVSAVPFLIALYQAFKLLVLIDKNDAFSPAAVQILQTIKRCGLAISALYVLGAPYIFSIAEQDDAPGVVLINIIIVGASFVVAVFAAVLRRLLQNALDIKAENELTV
jgi:hypothetical protein